MHAVEPWNTPSYIIRKCSAYRSEPPRGTHFDTELNTGAMHPTEPTRYIKQLIHESPYLFHSDTAGGRMHTSKLRTLSLFVIIGAVAAIFTGCSNSDSELRRVLTRYDRYNPPESRVKAAPSEYPTMYVRRSGGELVGVVNAEPLAGIDDAIEQPIRELTTQLGYVRRAMQERAEEGETIASDVLLVLNKDFTFVDAMRAIYAANAAGFPAPHLVTKKGYLHSVETPMVHPQAGPYGWSAWMWISEGDTVRWMPIPESAVVPGVVQNPDDVWQMKIPPVRGSIDFATLAAQMKATIDTLDYIPEASDRLIGIWAYDDLPYETLIRLFDTLRTDTDEMVGGRVTVLQGLQWSPPPDSVMTVRYPEPRQ